MPQGLRSCSWFPAHYCVLVRGGTLCRCAGHGLFPLCPMPLGQPGVYLSAVGHLGFLGVLSLPCCVKGLVPSPGTVEPCSHSISPVPAAPVGLRVSQPQAWHRKQAGQPWQIRIRIWAWQGFCRSGSDDALALFLVQNQVFSSIFT